MARDTKNTQVVDIDGNFVEWADDFRSRMYLASKQATLTRRNGESILCLVSTDEDSVRRSRPLTLRDYAGSSYHYVEHFAGGKWCFCLAEMREWMREYFMGVIIDVMPQHPAFGRRGTLRQENRARIAREQMATISLRAA